MEVRASRRAVVIAVLALVLGTSQARGEGGKADSLLRCSELLSLRVRSGVERAFVDTLARVGRRLVSDADLRAMLRAQDPFLLVREGPSERTHLHRLLAELAEASAKLPSSEQARLNASMLSAVEKELGRRAGLGVDEDAARVSRREAAQAFRRLPIPQPETGSAGLVRLFTLPGSELALVNQSAAGPSVFRLSPELGTTVEWAPAPHRPSREQAIAEVALGGTLVAVAMEHSREVVLWDRSLSRVISVIPFASPEAAEFVRPEAKITALAVSPMEGALAVTFSDGQLATAVRDAASSSWRVYHHRRPRPGGLTTSLSFLTETSLRLQAEDGSILEWKAGGQSKARPELNYVVDETMGSALSRTGELVAMARPRQETLDLWGGEGLKQVSLPFVNSERGDARAVIFSPEGTHVALLLDGFEGFGPMDYFSRVYLIEVASRRVASLRFEEVLGSGLRFTEDETFLLIPAADGRSVIRLGVEALLASGARGSQR